MSTATDVVLRLLAESDERIDQYRREYTLDRFAKHNYEYERARNTTLHTVLGEIRKAEK
jgi:hypothetical protein